MRHFCWDTFTEFTHLKEGELRSLTRTHLLKVKLRLIQSLSHDITFHGISVCTCHSLFCSLSLFFIQSLHFPCRRKRNNQFLEVVRRSFQPCDTHGNDDDDYGDVGSQRRPRIRIHFAFISFFVLTCDRYIYFVEPECYEPLKKKTKKTSSCRVISLTFRRSRHDKKKIITAFSSFFLSLVFRLLTHFFTHLHTHLNILSSPRRLVAHLQSSTHNGEKSRNRMREEEKKIILSSLFLVSVFSTICPHGFDVHQICTHAVRIMASPTWHGMARSDWLRIFEVLTKSNT